jgi:plastocyanin
VVWLEAENAPPARQARRVVLDQRNLTFSPHVLAVRVGTTVDFPNNDRVFHNVFSFRNGKRFDLGLYPVGAVRQVKFTQAGLSRLFCNIHPNMAAYVLAVDTPYFAVTDKRGMFRIPDAPAGKYTYHAWRPGGTDLSGTVVVEAGKPLEVTWQ